MEIAQVLRALDFAHMLRDGNAASRLPWLHFVGERLEHWLQHRARGAGRGPDGWIRAL